jgi:pimeloyl-ACP methyl ester carboxylesterase
MQRSRSAMVAVGSVLFAGSLAACGTKIMATDVPWQPPPYFAQECYADVDGVRVCYLEAGVEHDDAVVFVHGWSGNVHNWWDQYEAFSRDHHVLIFDLPGHGKSDKGADVHVTMDSLVETVVSLMTLRGIERATLVGNSAGGNVAARVAIAHPERVERLVLSDATGSGRDGIIAWFKPSVSPERLNRAGLTSGEHFPGDDPKSRARAEMIRSYVGTEEEAPYLQSLSDSFAMYYERIPKQQLQQLKMPTLLIWGADDPVVPKRSIHYFERNIAQAQTFWIDGAGHNPNTETPAVFNCALAAFLDQRPVGGCEPGPPAVDDDRRLTGPGTSRSTAQ